MGEGETEQLTQTWPPAPPPGAVKYCNSLKHISDLNPIIAHHLMVFR